MARLSTPPARLSAAPSRVGFLTDKAADKQRYRARYRTNPLRKLYHTKRWKELRLSIAERDEWICQATGIQLTAEPNKPNSLIVDHRTPHKGDEALFWDRDNLHAVSKAWHDAEKQRLDHAAGHHRAGGVGVDP